MKDLDGLELEVGAVYHMLASGSRIVICKFSHETEFSFIFNYVKNYRSIKDEPVIFSWKRILSKQWSSNALTKSLPVVKVSQAVIDKYNIS